MYFFFFKLREDSEDLFGTILGVFVGDFADIGKNVKLIQLFKGFFHAMFDGMGVLGDGAAQNDPDIDGVSAEGLGRVVGDVSQFFGSRQHTLTGLLADAPRIVQRAVYGACGDVQMFCDVVDGCLFLSVHGFFLISSDFHYTMLPGKPSRNPERMGILEKLFLFSGVVVD